MGIIEVYQRTPELIKQLVHVWESSVKATHHFLSANEMDHIKQYVPQAIESVAHLQIIEDENKRPIAFMGIEDDRLEMLFIEDKKRGQGIGKQFVEYGIKMGVKKVTVNEQNPRAKGFYEHMGFVVYKRTETDEQGNPYPILYMKLGKKH